MQKTIYFFRTLKDKIADFIPNNTEGYKKNISLDYTTVTPVKKYLDNIVKERFRDVFESTFDFDPDMCLRCDYSNETEKYIPAGRSMLTLLGNQLPYFFGNLTDRSKRNIGGATMDFIDHIFEIRSLFANGLKGVKKSFFVKIDVEDE